MRVMCMTISTTHAYNIPQNRSLFKGLMFMRAVTTAKNVVKVKIQKNSCLKD